MEFHKIYHPITAFPLAQDDSYMEFEPCRELKPYVRCFWGTNNIYRQKKMNPPRQELITPDTCMDIIFTADFTNNRVEGNFYGIDDRTFEAHHNNNGGKIVSTFAVRFYAWSAVLFSEDSMKDTKNRFFDAGHHFAELKKKIEPLLFEVTDTKERIRITETYLLQRMQMRHSSLLVMDAVAQILASRGNIEIGSLAKNIHTSGRQLERVFGEYIGISPKKLASLVRYQYLWNDIVYRSDFHVQDAVHRYGYTDQAHLLKDFKRFHTMTISEARKHAYEHVVFLQEDF